VSLGPCVKLACSISLRGRERYSIVGEPSEAHLTPCGLRVGAIALTQLNEVRRGKDIGVLSLGFLLAINGIGEFSESS
jgi:hypothetical protein